MINKLRTFLALTNETKRLLGEAYFYLALARILKALPFSKVAPMLGMQMVETTFTPQSMNKRQLAQISQAIHLMSHYTFWESQCLVKAIAAMKMLEKRQIECTLYLGMAKDETGKLVAHAWLRSGPFYITGAEGMERFTIVQKFAKNI